MPWIVDMILDVSYFIEPENEIIDLTEKKLRRSTRKRKKTDFFNYDERVLRRSKRKTFKPHFFSYDDFN
tara:strand:- start:616 stop:822 length:207 start_codon:yes stop_codon:yes gene_type:complete